MKTIFKECPHCKKFFKKDTEMEFDVFDFFEALKKMKEGKNVFCLDWDVGKDRYLKLRGREFFDLMLKEDLFRPRDYNLKATDLESKNWVLFD